MFVDHSENDRLLDVVVVEVVVVVSVVVVVIANRIQE